MLSSLARRIVESAWVWFVALAIMVAALAQSAWNHDIFGMVWSAVTILTAVWWVHTQLPS